MDDSGSENLINFSVSPERKFVPLVPIPTEPAFVSSLEFSPFDNGEAASSSEDPFELVLRSAEVQENEKSDEVLEMPNSNKLLEECDTSYVARVQPRCLGTSLIQALAVEGIDNFSCDENITYIMDISDPNGEDSTSEFVKPAVTTNESKCSNSLLEITANKKDEMVPGRDITTLVNEKLNSCIQMVLNGSCSLPQQDSGACARQVRRSLVGARLLNDGTDVSSQKEPTPSNHKSLDVSLDSALKQHKVSHHYSDGDDRATGGRVPSCSDESTASVFNRAFLQSASNTTGNASQDSGASCSSNVLPSESSRAASSVMIRRWLNTADVGTRTLCDSRFNHSTPATDGVRSPPARTSLSLGNNSCASVLTPPLLMEQDSQGRAGDWRTSQDGSDHSFKDMNVASPEDHVAWEALRVAHNISNSIAGNLRDETLDDIEMDLVSSDEDDDQHPYNLQQNEYVTLQEPAVQPLPLNMDRVSGLSLLRSPVLPPPLLDQSKLMLRLKQLKASNHLPTEPEKKIAPLRAVVPVCDMKKSAAGGNDARLLAQTRKTSQPVLACGNKNEEKIESVTSAISSSKLRKSSSSLSLSVSSSHLHSRQSSPSITGSGRKEVAQSHVLSKPGIPVPHPSPRSSSSGRSPCLNASPRAPITSTPIHSATQGVAISHVFPSMTPVSGGRQLNRASSRAPNSRKENVSKKCGEAPRRRSKSSSNLPMKNVENRMLNAKGQDYGCQKQNPLKKMLPHVENKFVRSSGNKENIFPV